MKLEINKEIKELKKIYAEMKNPFDQIKRSRKSVTNNTEHIKSY